MNSSGENDLKVATEESPLLAGLIRREVLESARRLKESLAIFERLHAAGTLGTTLTARAAISTANQHAATLLNKMEMLAALAETYAGQSDDQRDRFFLLSLADDIVKTKLGVPPGRFILKEPDRQVGPVYGNKRWLELMVTHLLHELDRAIHPSEQRIVLTLHQLGNHIIMRAQNETALQPEQKRDQPPALRVEGLTFSLCRRIAELHGGTLCLDAEACADAAELTGFVLSLPTSSPSTPERHRCAEPALTQQIENYASDLAELMDRCRALEQTRSMNDGDAVNR